MWTGSGAEDETTTDKNMGEGGENVEGVELSDELGDGAWQLVEGGENGREILER
jgi:hypothetical protein